MNDCRACRHSYQSADLTLRCRVTGQQAAIPCLKFQREPGTDVEEYIAWQDGHVSPDQGRGD